MRPRLYKNYSTTTLKLDRNTMEGFELFLGKKSKNSYIVEKVIEMRKFFEDATDDEKSMFFVSLMPYSVARKHIGDVNDESRRKDKVVSVKCEKEDYEMVVLEIEKMGFTFSEIIRKIIIKDISTLE